MFYDFFASENRTRFGSWNAERYWRKLVAALNETDSFRGRVLELGPGEGAFAAKCREAELEYSALERSPTLRKRLEDQGYDVKLGSAPPLPYEDSRFDLVTAIAIVEHMPTFEQALALLQECHRVLRPDGRLAVLTPDYRRCGIDFYNWDYTHSFATTPFRIKTLLHDTGFRPLGTSHFSGSLTGPARWVIDLLGFAVHSRMFYWVSAGLGFERWLLRYHKTFEPSFLVIARKDSAPTGVD